MIRTLKVKEYLMDAICVNIDHEKYIIYATPYYGCLGIGQLCILNCKDINKKEPQVLDYIGGLDEEANLMYDGKYLYVISLKGIEISIYEILKENDKFVVNRIKEIFDTSKRVRRLSILRDNRMILFNDYSLDYSIYELKYDKFKTIIKGLDENKDLEVNEKTKEFLKNNNMKIFSTYGSKYTSFYYNDITNEMIYKDEDIIVFEKDKEFNGMIRQKGKFFGNISSDLSGGLILVMYDIKTGSHIVLLEKDDVNALKQGIFI